MIYVTVCISATYPGGGKCLILNELQGYRDEMGVAVASHWFCSCAAQKMVADALFFIFLALFCLKKFLQR